MLIPMGFLAAAGGGPSAAMELISTVTSTGSTSTVSFNVSGLGSTYKHLQVRVVARNNFGDFYGRLWLRMNGDTGNNYSGHYLIGNGSTAASYNSPNANRIEVGQVSGNGQPSGVFSPTIVDIVDAFSTNKNKTFRSFTGQSASGGETFVHVVSGVWLNTAVLTSVDLGNVYGTAFAAGSRISLYGIKG